MTTMSVITPLHAPGNQFIREAYASLARQTRADWEWVVLENHGGVVPNELLGDPRVRVCKAPEMMTGIGALKRQVCEVATGDIIVELDCDDLLVPIALERITRAFAEGADFVFSNSAEFEHETWVPHTYSSVFGWRQRPFTYEGHELIEMIAPPATAQNMRRIEWSPNHVRAWTREAYTEVGGHDPSRAVADDHHLVVRFALAGKRMVHINECLYLYRVHPQNNVKTQNAEIQAGTDAVYNEFVWKLAEWGADRANLAKVDLGGAFDAPPGYVVLDANAGLRCDLNERWPLEDNSVGLIRAYDIVEHLRDPVHTMNEAYRVLAPGGWLMVSVPSALGQGAYQDPTHCSFWVRNSFLYYTDRRWSKYIPKFRGRFAVSRVIEWFPSDWHREQNVPYVEAGLIVLKSGYDHMGVVSI